MAFSDILGMVHGKAIIDATVTRAKLTASLLTSILFADGSNPLTGPLNFNGQRGVSVGAPQSPTDIARLMDLQAKSYKDAVQVATTGPITLSGLQPIDGVAVQNGWRVLVRLQTTAADNGIRIASSGAWQRSQDADAATDLMGAVVFVEKGLTLKGHSFAQNGDDINTLDTDPVVFSDIGVGTPPAYPNTVNKNMPASATTANFQLGCQTALAKSPAGGYVGVNINHIPITITEDRAGAGYWSGDNGASAKTFASVIQGDKFYFNQDFAGYALETTDRVDYVFVHTN